MKLIDIIKGNQSEDKYHQSSKMIILYITIDRHRLCYVRDYRVMSTKDVFSESECIRKFKYHYNDNVLAYRFR